MGEMQAFSNEQFGTLHMITRNGEPWFFAKDICNALQLGNPRSSIALLDDDEKGVHSMDTPGGKQDVSIVSESGMYSMFLRSRRPEAKAFKRWITHDVIPSIRKYGAYATPATIDNILNDPDFGIRLLTELKEERNKRAALEEKIESDAPFTEFGMAISTTKGSITVKQFAANLCQLGYKTGEKRMFEEFRQDGFLLTSGNYRNEPAQRCMEMGLFEVRTSSYDTPMGTKIGRQVLITAKGLQYFIDYYMRKHGLMTLLTVHRQRAIETRRPR